jgi:hypothetical protein
MRDVVCSTTPVRSDSSMTISSSPPSLISTTDHLPGQQLVAHLNLRRVTRAVFGAGARANRDDRTLHRLFLHGIGDENSDRAHLLRIDAADYEAIRPWTKCHQVSSEQSVHPIRISLAGPNNFGSSPKWVLFSSMQ